MEILKLKSTAVALACLLLLAGLCCESRRLPRALDSDNAPNGADLSQEKDKGCKACPEVGNQTCVAVECDSACQQEPASNRIGVNQFQCKQTSVIEERLKNGDGVQGSSGSQDVVVSFVLPPTEASYKAWNFMATVHYHLERVSRQLSTGDAIPTVRMQVLTYYQQGDVVAAGHAVPGTTVTDDRAIFGKAVSRLRSNGSSPYASGTAGKYSSDSAVHAILETMTTDRPRDVCVVVLLPSTVKLEQISKTYLGLLGQRECTLHAGVDFGNKSDQHPELLGTDHNNTLILFDGAGLPLPYSFVSPKLQTDIFGSGPGDAIASDVVESGGLYFNTRRFQTDIFAPGTDNHYLPGFGTLSTLLEGSTIFHSTRARFVVARVIAELSLGRTPLMDGLNCSCAHLIGNTSIVCTRMCKVCNKADFQCKSGRPICISQGQVCDGYKNCLDGSDESECPGSGNSTAVPCQTSLPCSKSPECLPVPSRSFCNKVPECEDSSDERYCAECNSSLVKHTRPDKLADFALILSDTDLIRDNVLKLPALLHHIDASLEHVGFAAAAKSGKDWSKRNLYSVISMDSRDAVLGRFLPSACSQEGAQDKYPLSYPVECLASAVSGASLVKRHEPAPPQDGYAALMFAAANYPWRKGALRNVIFVTDAERLQTDATEGISRTLLERHYSQNGITPHFLVDNRFVALGKPDPSRRNVTGGSFNVAPPPGHPEFYPRHDFKRQTYRHYIRLAREATGSMWDVEFLRRGTRHLMRTMGDYLPLLLNLKFATRREFACKCTAPADSGCEYCGNLTNYMANYACHRAADKLYQETRRDEEPRQTGVEYRRERYEIKDKSCTYKNTRQNDLYFAARRRANVVIVTSLNEDNKDVLNWMPALIHGLNRRLVHGGLGGHGAAPEDWRNSFRVVTYPPDVNRTRAAGRADRNRTAARPHVHSILVAGRLRPTALRGDGLRAISDVLSNLSATTPNPDGDHNIVIVVSQTAVTGDEDLLRGLVDQLPNARGQIHFVVPANITQKSDKRPLHGSDLRGKGYILSRHHKLSTTEADIAGQAGQVNDTFFSDVVSKAGNGTVWNVAGLQHPSSVYNFTRTFVDVVVERIIEHSNLTADCVRGVCAMDSKCNPTWTETEERSDACQLIRDNSSARIPPATSSSSSGQACPSPTTAGVSVFEPLDKNQLGVVVIFREEELENLTQLVAILKQVNRTLTTEIGNLTTAFDYYIMEMSANTTSADAVPVRFGRSPTYGCHKAGIPFDQVSPALDALDENQFILQYRKEVISEFLQDRDFISESIDPLVVLIGSDFDFLNTSQYLSEEDRNSKRWPYKLAVSTNPALMDVEEPMFDWQTSAVELLDADNASQVFDDFVDNRELYVCRNCSCGTCGSATEGAVECITFISDTCDQKAGRYNFTFPKYPYSPNCNNSTMLNWSNVVADRVVPEPPLPTVTIPPATQRRGPAPDYTIEYAAGASAGALALLLAGLAALLVVRARRLKMLEEEEVVPEPSFEAAMRHMMTMMLAPYNIDIMVLPTSLLRFSHMLGKGQFGEVHLGTMNTRGKNDELIKEKVAIKTVLGDPSLEDINNELMKEFVLQKSVGEHPNIVQILLGGIFEGRTCIVMEYMAGGDLHTFLRSIRGFARMTSLPTGPTESLCFEEKLDICRQVALGMEFLAEHGIVHRDLAARNVLVREHPSMEGKLEVKISDLGLSRKAVLDGTYQARVNRPLPIKWMAIESIEGGSFSEKTDVWSYGVLMWEVETFGETPYRGTPNALLLQMLQNGHRLERPQTSTNIMYYLMKSCWDIDPEKRPTFEDMVHNLSKELEVAMNYLAISEDDLPSALAASADRRPSKNWENVRAVLDKVQRRSLLLSQSSASSINESDEDDSVTELAMATPTKLASPLRDTELTDDGDDRYVVRHGSQPRGHPVPEVRISEL